MPRPTSPLVGRVVELRTAADAVRGAASGAAAAVIVSGDAGVGKTRLLAELTALAAEDGMQCLIGHCVDLGDTPPPYLPFAEALRRFAGEQPEVMDALVVRHPSLGRLLRGRAGADGGHDDRVERGELFDAVRGALVQLSTERPVALFIEDAHWADQASRDLLGYLFTRIEGDRLAIVVSYRSDDLNRRHPLRRTLAEWSRLPILSRINLEPLGAEDVTTLLQANRPETLSDADVQDIVRRAEGNAFFAEELLAATVQIADTQQLPWQLADLLLVRLDRLSDAARQVVRVAAVGGRRVPHEMLAAVANLPAGQLDDALREAVDSHVVQLTSSGRGYVFRHALLAEAVYDDLLPGERVRLHAAYAAALASADPAAVAERSAELARHARASHDLGTAFEASIAAGHQAMSLAAPQEALQQFEAALEILPQLAHPSTRIPALTLAAVEAAEGAGHGLRGVKLADAALADLPADAAPLDRAILLFALVKASVAGEISEQTFGQISEALHLVPVRPPTPFRARVLAMHARVSYYIGRQVDAVRSAREAVEVADVVGSEATGTDARTTLALVERRTGEPEEAARLLDEVAEQARAAGDTASELRSRYSLASLWFEQSDLPRAMEAFHATHRRAVQTGRPWENFGLMSRAMAATIHFARGDWDDALHTLDTAGEQPPPIGDAVLTSTRMLVHANQGAAGVMADFERLRRYFRREGRVPLYSGFAALTIYEHAADPPAALVLIDELIDILGSLWMDPWFLARIQLSALGLAVLCAKAAVSSETAHAGLAIDGDRLVTDGRTSAELGLTRGRRMGREGQAWLARLEAEWVRLRWLTGHETPSADVLVGAWRNVVTEFDYGERFELTRSRARLAAALRATAQVAEAAQIAQLARADAEAMGAAPLLAEIAAIGLSASARRGITQRGVSQRGAGQHGAGQRDARQRGAGERSPETSSGFSALTERERDVLAELVDGRTNRQIAAKLFISEKTVSVHVSNILAKVGVRSRAEAAALARRDATPSPE